MFASFHITIVHSKLFLKKMYTFCVNSAAMVGTVQNTGRESSMGSGKGQGAWSYSHESCNGIGEIKNQCIGQQQFTASIGSERHLCFCVCRWFGKGTYINLSSWRSFREIHLFWKVAKQSRHCGSSKPNVSQLSHGCKEVCILSSIFSGIKLSCSSLNGKNNSFLIILKSHFHARNHVKMPTTF